MPDPLRTTQPAADVVMRRMLNLASQLHATCAGDAAELRRLRDKRQVDLAAAESAARARTEQAITTCHELAQPKSLGSRLRAELSKHTDARHVDAGSPPTDFDTATAEWSALARSSEQRVRELRTAFEAFEQRLIKRAKSSPRVDDTLWRDLDRLDLIHRALPALTQGYIATKIQEASGAADVVLEAEAQRRAAGQQHLADELHAALAVVESHLGLSAAQWSDGRWESPSPAVSVEHLIRLGELVPDVPRNLGVETIPALVAFPFVAGVAVQSDVARRQDAAGFLKSLVLRLFAAVPPAALQVTVIDPVSLGQSAAEFRHLAEYDDRLMDEKTWTSERDIERVMDRLADHIEVVISQFLKGQFETIDDYNRHAGEVAQPYRALVVFDYPSGFSDRASRQLLSLIENGPRCGVYTLFHHLPSASSGSSRDAISSERLTRDMHRVALEDDGGRLDLPDPVGHVDLRLIPDIAPPIVFDADGHPVSGGARLLTAIGSATRQSQERPTAVTLASLLPVLRRARTGVKPAFSSDVLAFGTDPRSWWQASSAENAVAPIGRSGAQSVTSVHFSSTDIAGGAIMVGLPRSGKTTSLHSMILTMAMLYSPTELELFLIDAKHGVEFKIYEGLPHARMVSTHSDREFSVAVLKALDQEIRARAELMKNKGAGRANLTEYRTATGEALPRIVVIIDEFHEIFEEPDRVGQEAFAAFSNIVRMGPFSGVHMVVASQTLSSMPAMDRPTLMLLPQRVAFMCNEYDAEILMGDTNQAPLRLSKTGEGVFNPARGEESRNQLFQGLYVSPQERNDTVQKLVDKAHEIGWTRTPRVFDGNAVVLRPVPKAASVVTGNSSRVVISIGEPFSLASTEELVLRRSRGGNLLLIGSEDDGSDRALTGALHSCLTDAARGGAEITIIDFGSDDIDDVVPLVEVAEACSARYVRSGGAAEVLRDVTSTVTSRTANGDYKAATSLVAIVGLERGLSLQPVDPYADEERSASADFLAILQGGPEVGVHVLVRADRSKTLERRIGVEAMQEFTLRVASSSTDHQDLAAVTGEYGSVEPLRPGQLLLGDQIRGVAKRVRGFAALTAADLAHLDRSAQ